MTDRPLRSLLAFITVVCLTLVPAIVQAQQRDAGAQAPPRTPWGGAGLEWCLGLPHAHAVRAAE